MICLKWYTQTCLTLVVVFDFWTFSFLLMVVCFCWRVASVLGEIIIHCLFCSNTKFFVLFCVVAFCVDTLIRYSHVCESTSLEEIRVVIRMRIHTYPRWVYPVLGFFLVFSCFPALVGIERFQNRYSM